MKIEFVFEITSWDFFAIGVIIAAGALLYFMVDWVYHQMNLKTFENEQIKKEFKKRGCK